MLFPCDLCDSGFRQHQHLRRHIKTFHKDVQPPSLKCEPSQWFECTLCPKKYRRKSILEFHLKKNHNKDLPDNRKRDVIKHRFACPLNCEFSECNRKDLFSHFQSSHNIAIETECFELPNYSKFVEWKDKVECVNNTRYVVSRNVLKSKLKTTRYFSCYRSGVYQPEGKGLRHLKSSGSNKIGIPCPASIKVCELNNDGKCHVYFTKTHIGHNNDLDCLRFSKQAKDVLSKKIAAKVPFDVILEDLKNINNPDSFDTIPLVTRKDLHNIGSSLNTRPMREAMLKSGLQDLQAVSNNQDTGVITTEAAFDNSFMCHSKQTEIVTLVSMLPSLCDPDTGVIIEDTPSINKCISKQSQTLPFVSNMSTFSETINEIPILEIIEPDDQLNSTQTKGEMTKPYTPVSENIIKDVQLSDALQIHSNQTENTQLDLSTINMLVLEDVSLLDNQCSLKQTGTTRFIWNPSTLSTSSNAVLCQETPVICVNESTHNKMAPLVILPSILCPGDPINTGLIEKISSSENHPDAIQNM